jgi:hypothetical protein
VHGIPENAAGFNISRSLTVTVTTLFASPWLRVPKSLTIRTRISDFGFYSKDIMKISSAPSPKLATVEELLDFIKTSAYLYSVTWIP